MNTKSVKRKLDYIFFPIFFAVLAYILWAMLYWPYRDRKQNKALSMSSAVSACKYQNGSDVNCFVNMQDGNHFLFYIPKSAIQVGDSIIKEKDADFFTHKSSNGQIKGYIDLDRKWRYNF